MIQTAAALFIGVSASLFVVRALSTGVASADWRTKDDAAVSFDKEQEPLNYWGLVGLLTFIAGAAFYTLIF